MFRVYRKKMVLLLEMFGVMSVSSMLPKIPILKCLGIYYSNKLCCKTKYSELALLINYKGDFQVFNLFRSHEAAGLTGINGLLEVPACTVLVMSAYRSTGTERASLKDKVGEIFPPIFGGFVKFFENYLLAREKCSRNFTTILNI